MNELVSASLLKDIRSLIDEAKTRVAIKVNQEMTLLYWNLGKRIHEDILKSERAEYGEQIIVTLSRYLLSEYGKGFSSRNITSMIHCYKCFHDFNILQTLSAKLTWSHFLSFLSLGDQNAIEFYAYMAIEANWSVRQLRANIHKMLFERTKASDAKNVLSENIKALKVGEGVSPGLILKEPYVLDFLQLPEEHSESELEAAILKEIEKFILEIGTGFSFIESQKRITIDDDHYYLDLLFFNRKLKRLVAIELKSGKFKPQYKGQMELYLGWLKRFEMLAGENPPIGIILCTEKSTQQIELLDMENSSIHIAEYWTELPPQDVFERKIREIVLRAQERNQLNIQFRKDKD